jgi:hypothetical protein
LLALPASQRVRSVVRLSHGPAFAADCMRALSKLQELTTLHIRCPQVGDDLKPLTEAQALTSLSIQDGDESRLMGISHCLHLSRLELQYFDNERIPRVLCSPSLVNLEELCLSHFSSYRDQNHPVKVTLHEWVLLRRHRQKVQLEWVVMWSHLNKLQFLTLEAANPMDFLLPTLSDSASLRNLWLTCDATERPRDMWPSRTAVQALILAAPLLHIAVRLRTTEVRRRCPHLVEELTQLQSMSDLPRVQIIEF